MTVYIISAVGFLLFVVEDRPIHR